MKTGPCPLCGSDKKKIIGGSLFYCCGCGCAYNSSHSCLDYSDSYFTEDYKKQYGRTYEEDYSAIYSASVKRIEKIKKFSGKRNRSILDIGSALGFFLKCAADSGYERTLGIEVSPFASKYCSSKFGIETILDSFSNVAIQEKFDVITSWYFIEHNVNPAELFDKIYSMLSRGGIYAMSVPSICGPSYCCNRDDWIKSHPVDHRVDFSPASVKKVLKRAGFRKIYIYPAGYHPERLLKSTSTFFPLFEIPYWLFTKVFKFSDTIEVYAVK